MSKHSRAARRGLIEDEGEAKELASIPKAESSDVKKSIIRTTIKNENLLAKKMENSKIRKSKASTKKTNTLKKKIDRSDKLSGVLSTKIEQSIARAKYVQSARKANWSQIDKSALEGMSVNISALEKPKPKTEAELEKEEEDAYVADFYNDETTEQPALVTSNNRFAVLAIEEE